NQTTSRPVDGMLRDPSSLPRPVSRPSLVELKQGQLLVGGKGLYFRGIRHSDTPLKALRDAGFNTVWFDYRTPPNLVEEAIDHGFWGVPPLPVTAESSGRLAGPQLENEIHRWQNSDAVLFWDLGGGLVDELKEPLRQAVKTVREVDPNRPVGAD